MAIVIAETDDDALLADYYHQHWLAMGLAPADVAPDWRERALAFIAAARHGRAFAGFVARDAGRPVGGACCHLVERAYPAFRVGDPAVVGYVWGVYVEPASRGRGLGAALVRACLGHLSARGCGRALLHAGEQSRPLYERLGFAGTDELALVLQAGS
ncbi:MAG TPA: GNAT family N-acetyltransferase [Gemmatirosa sp.]|jgi:GNAT superfamily N-acetyltransferase|nr:GNAT family N-acetyltransferase [Gemmatirosa sp.]